MNFETLSDALNVPHRVFRIGDVEFDETRWELTVAGQRQAVEAKPLALLHALLAHPGEVVTKDELLSAVWPGVFVTEASLTTAVAKLRAALGGQGRAIVEAVHGIGYRIGVPVALLAGPARARMAFTFKAGDVVANRPQWRLERTLGAQAGNAVWLARHLKTGEMRVFKFADSTDGLHALKREVTLSRVLTAAFGERDEFIPILEWNFDTRPYLIESAYGGENLADWATACGGLSSIPLAERLSIAATVAGIVAAAHGVGVMHRDIKPENVLIAQRRSGANVVRLVDFGAGGLSDAGRLAALNITDLGLTAPKLPGSDRGGTLRYAAPEVLAGGLPTVAGDVFSLGVLLYQMAAGDFSRSVAPGWEDDVGDTLLREDIALAAAGDPSRRRLSAADLAERLECLEQRRAVRQAEDAQAAEFEQLRRTAELRRIEAAAAAEREAHALALARRTRWAALVLLLLVTSATVLSIAALREKRIAAAQRDRAEQVTHAATDAVASLVTDMLTGLRDEACVSVAGLQQTLGKSGAILEVMRNYAPGDFALQRLYARVLTEFANTYLHGGNLGDALKAADRASSLFHTLLARDPGNIEVKLGLSESLHWTGDIKLKQLDLPGAMLAYRSRLAIDSQLAAADPGNRTFLQQAVRSEEEVGDVELAHGDGKAAIAAYAHARSSLAHAPLGWANDPGLKLDLSTVEEKLGDAFEELGNPRSALQSYENDLALRQQLLKQDPGNQRVLRDLSVAEGDVGEEQILLGDPTAAIASLAQAQVLARSLAQSDPGNAMYQRDVAAGLSDIAHAKSAAGDIVGAEASFAEGIASMKRLVAKSPTDVGFQEDWMEMEGDMASALLRSGDRAGAAVHLSQARELASHLMASHSPDKRLVSESERFEKLALEMSKAH